MSRIVPGQGTTLETRLETPEGIDLEVSPAGPVPRGLAVMVDATITQFGTGLLGAGLYIWGSAGIGVYLVIMFLVEWFYPVFFEVLGRGQTPGKRMFGLRVLNADATPIGWNASIIRNLMRTADFFPAFYLGGLLSMCLTRRFQRLGDLAADTMVVHARGIVERTIYAATEASVDVRGEAAPLGLGDRALGARTVPLLLTAIEQRAILGFAERYAELSDERSVELTDVLEPVTHARGEAGRIEVLRIANGLAGSA